MKLGLTAEEAATVVVSAVGVYAAFLVLVRLAGRRLLAPASVVDVAGAIALGAVMGRSILGYTPTLAAGVIGMTTLLVLHTALSLAGRAGRPGPLLGPPPLLLLADGRVVASNLRRARLTEEELRQRLRIAGVRRYDEVAAAVLERTGALSVLRRGEAISPEMLADVEGAEQLRGQG